MNDKFSELDRFRSIPFYFVNTKEPLDLSEKEILNSMTKLKDSGFGGCVVFNKPPNGFSREDYLGDKWFEMISRFVEAGKRLRLQIWINDGFDYPPGDAGGRIQKLAPHLKQRRFVRRDTGEITIEEVDYGFPAFEEPESSTLFIEQTYEVYKKQLGKYFGKGITGFFSDADCRRYMFQPFRYFPAARNFFERFKDAYNYDLAPHLNAIMDDRGGQAQHDYWEFCGNLYAQWFKNNYCWCQANGVKYSFHTSDVGPFAFKDCARSSIFTEGKYLTQSKYCDYPGTDHELLSIDSDKPRKKGWFIPAACWGGSADKVRDPDFNNTLGDLRAKYAASAAFIYKRERALCEAFAATNWGCRHGDLRRIATWQIMQGINLFIPHAVHHRLCGDLKYFAPPDLSSYGSLTHGMRQFNDWLAFMCMIASQGELVAPIAVVDTTRSVWRGESDGKELFVLCDRLNRMPYNYVIADDAALLAAPNRFSAVITPGITLTKELMSALSKAGVPIIASDELERLPELLGRDMDFSGDGQPHFMRRRLASGKEFCLVANVSSDQPINGCLRVKDQSREIELQPGEIAIIGEIDEYFRAPTHGSRETLLTLPDEYDVEWERDNCLPLSRWENSTGVATVLYNSQESLVFKWTNRESIESIDLLVPKEIQPGDVAMTVDGKPMISGENTKIFEDNYRRFKLDHALAVGEHVITWKGNKEITVPKWDNLYLSGNFSVNVETSGDFAKHYYNYYNMDLYLPSKANVFLSKRQQRLKPYSWTKQGHPFYSGAATYRLKIAFPDSFPGGILVFPEIESVCSVKLDGQAIGTCIWAPYEFTIPPLSGMHTIEVFIRNTFANMLEAYRAPSGLLERPLIVKKPG